MKSDAPGATHSAGSPGLPLDPRIPSDSGSHVVPPVYLTAEVPGIGGRTRQRPEDFLVEEVPQYEPCGQGEHIYLFVEKREMTTPHLARLLAAHFGVRLSAVGYAGLKDKHAITRQVMSVHTPGKKPADFPSLRHAGASVLWADLHTNKLRRGHLRGNRFSIRIRGVEPARVLDAGRALRLLARDGAPNRVGQQRFGGRGNNHLVGLALARGDAARAIDLLLTPMLRRESPLAAADANPIDAGPGVMTQASRLFAEGRFREAIDACPRSARAERRVLGALARGCDALRAARAVDESDRTFFINAFQSAVFNAVLDERLRAGTLAALREGDLAFKHANGALFAVDAATAADESTGHRLRGLEISATGPMWGPAMPRAGEPVNAREVAALQRAGLELADLPALEQWGGSSAAGVRRPLRAPVIDPDVEAGADEHGPFIRCAFELPPGAFATTILQEIMKTDAPTAPALGHDDDES